MNICISMVVCKNCVLFVIAARHSGEDLRRIFDKRKIDDTQTRKIYIYIWICLKIGYIPNYSHLIGIMIINHWV